MLYACGYFRCSWQELDLYSQSAIFCILLLFWLITVEHAETLTRDVAKYNIVITWFTVVNWSPLNETKLRARLGVVLFLRKFKTRFWRSWWGQISMVNAKQDRVCLGFTLLRSQCAPEQQGTMQEITQSGKPSARKQLRREICKINQTKVASTANPTTGMLGTAEQGCYLCSISYRSKHINLINFSNKCCLCLVRSWSASFFSIIFSTGRWEELTAASQVRESSFLLYSCFLLFLSTSILNNQSLGCVLNRYFFRFRRTKNPSLITRGQIQIWNYFKANI